MNIYKALAKVMADIGHVGKDDKNTHQGFKFRGIDAVLNAVGPVLRKHGVVVVPVLQSADYEAVKTSTGKSSMSCRVVCSFVFYAEDGSSIETKVAAEAMDSGDKATPKAMSVAFRTALLQTLALPTDEPDPDSFTYERHHEPEQRSGNGNGHNGNGHRNTPAEDADLLASLIDEANDMLETRFARGDLNEANIRHLLDGAGVEKLSHFRRATDVERFMKDIEAFIANKNHGKRKVTA